MRHDPRMHRDAEREVAGIALGLEHGEVVGERAATAAVLLRDRAQQQAQFACGEPYLAVDAMLSVPLLVVRDHLAFEEPDREFGQSLTSSSCQEGVCLFMMFLSRMVSLRGAPQSGAARGALVLASAFTGGAR